MKTRTAVAIVASIVVAGCAATMQSAGTAGGGPGMAGGRPACRPGADCSTPVSATFCSIPEPEVITVEGGAVDLVWNLDWGVLGYTFVGKGITVQDDRYNEFGPPQMTDRKVTIRDSNTRKGSHKYTITIKNRFATCKPLDPTIVNQGSS